MEYLARAIKIEVVIAVIAINDEADEDIVYYQCVHLLDLLTLNLKKVIFVF